MTPDAIPRCSSGVTHRRFGQHTPPATAGLEFWRPQGCWSWPAAPDTGTALPPAGGGTGLALPPQGGDTGGGSPRPPPAPWRYLAEEGDGFLPHGVSITNVGLDDLSEGLGDTLQGQETGSGTG